MNNFKNIIFDLDGTLTNTLPVICDAFNHVISPYSGRHHPPEEIYSWFGPPEEEIIGRFLPPGEVEQGMNKLYQYYRRSSPRIRLFKGLQEILDTLLKRGNHICLFTGKSRRGTEITLEQLGITGHFSFIITGNDVIRPKPDPEGIEKLLTLLNGNPRETLLVGDTMADIRAGAGSGVKTGLAQWGSGPNHTPSVKPDYTFSDPSDLARILQNS